MTIQDMKDVMFNCGVDAPTFDKKIEKLLTDYKNGDSSAYFPLACSLKNYLVDDADCYFDDDETPYTEEMRKLIYHTYYNDRDLIIDCFASRSAACSAVAGALSEEVVKAVIKYFHEP